MVLPRTSQGARNTTPTAVIRTTRPEADSQAMAPSDERHLDGAPEIDVDAGGDFRAGETGDATQASEEGLAWVPPMDPPVIPGDRGDPEIAAGFGTTAEDDPFDADHAGELLSPHGQVEELV